MTCKGCFKDEPLDMNGFCSAGICQLRSEGYSLGFWAAQDIQATQQHVCCYGNHIGATLGGSLTNPIWPLGGGLF